MTILTEHEGIMSRISKAAKSAYKSIGAEDECHYCGTHISSKFLREYTPQVSCGYEAVISFIEDPTVTTACSSCYAKIQKANQTFSIGRGMMTLEDKMVLISGSKQARARRLIKFTIEPGLSYLVPAGTTYDPENQSVYYDFFKYSLDEVRAIQSILYLIRSQAPRWVIDQQWEFIKTDVSADSIPRLIKLADANG